MESVNLQQSNDAECTTIAPSSAPAHRVVAQHSETAPCSSCAAAAAAKAAPTSFIYSLGRIEARFPNLGLEKEFAQATGRERPEATTGKSGQEIFQSILANRENRYLARQLCWVMAIGGLETYLLAPRDSADIELFVNSIRSRPSPLDMDIVIGRRGPIARPEMCNGLLLPIVAVDQIYSFDRETLLKSAETGKGGKDSTAAAGEVLDRVLQMADNAGATDEHRALNYLVVRYAAVYTTTSDAFARNASLTAVSVRPSPHNGTRRLVDVIFSYTHRTTDVTEKFFVRVDVTEEFPFLVTKMSPYYDR